MGKIVRVTYIISKINKSLAFEWISDELDKSQFDLQFILLNDRGSDLEQYLLSRRVVCHRIYLRGKKTFPLAFLRILLVLMVRRPAVIHCHMFDACLIGLVAGWLLAIKKRIFTRHSGSYNWHYNKKGLRYDKLFAWLATDIVAVSKNVENLLVKKEGASRQKVHLIHHGFKLEDFSQISAGRINGLRHKYNPDMRWPVVGVISRWLHLKGLQYIILAFKKLLNNYPDAFLILANASGPYTLEVESLLEELPQTSYVTIPFENDLFALYQLFDVYVHTPINPTVEAFGQTYVEALAAGIPSVFTLSGVAPEFIEHGKNALVVDFGDEDGIYSSVVRLLTDKELSERLVEKGKRDIQRFNLDSMIDKLKKLYQVSEHQVRR